MGSDDLYRKKKTLDLYKKKKKRTVQNKILIVCEGEKTEPLYFKSFPINYGEIEVKVAGIAMNTLSLVNKTIELKKNATKKGEEYNQIWCVFDKDSFPDSDFDNAIKKAKAHNFRLGFSNEAFELWFLLHFEYYNYPMPRKDYEKKINEKINKKYKKNILIYKDILECQENAIDNAKRLYEQKLSERLPFSKCNPITTVFLLVEELNKWI